jgi:cell wall-associated NlpC family hydrolase
MNVVEIARQWEGTPHHKQASVRGVGADCKGHIYGVARDAGLPAASAWYAKVADYGDYVPVELLREGLQACFDKVEGDPLPGDVLLLKVGRPIRPQHLAIYMGDGKMQHATMTGPERVITVPMGRVWLERLDSVWRWKTEVGA